MCAYSSNLACRCCSDVNGRLPGVKAQRGLVKPRAEMLDGVGAKSRSSTPLVSMNFVTKVRLFGGGVGERPDIPG
jgi:hypothetical protein